MGREIGDADPHGAGDPRDVILEDFAFRYGRTYDSYLVTEPGWKQFWSRGESGVVGFMQHGRRCFVAGGLLAPEAHRPELLAEVVEQADTEKLSLTFLNVVEEDLPLFERFGFQVTKWGEEALIDLPDCDWSGGAYEWVRRQSNFCRRNRLVVDECDREAVPANAWPAIAAELCEVSAEFLADKPQEDEIRFLQGGFDPHRQSRQRIFAARAEEGQGRIEAFLACNPGRGGAMWTMETYRQRGDAIRGVIPFLMHQTMQILRAEGALAASLCLVPGLGCRQRLPGDSPLVRRSMVLGLERFGWLFDSAGAYHFKTRFRPRFESRYVCARPQFSFGMAWAFVRLLGVLDVTPSKVVRRTLARLRKRSSRETLTRAEAEPS